MGGIDHKKLLPSEILGEILDTDPWREAQTQVVVKNMPCKQQICLLL